MPADELEDDELIDLNFTEDAISQPYLSLGLTPLSQLSPDAQNSSELGFFPSMPPPVSPASSVFNTTGISVDNPFSLGPPQQSHADAGMNGMVMPEAVPAVAHLDMGGRRGMGRRGKHHDYTASLSQGYSKRLLETVPEVSASPEHGHFGDLYGRKQNGHHRNSSSSSDEMKTEESNLLDVFPSAEGNQDYGALLKRQEGGVGRPVERQEWSSTVLANRGAFANGFGGEEMDAPMRDYSPRQEGRLRRQRARELALAREKEQLKRKREEEDQRRREQRQVKIAQEFSRVRVRHDQIPRTDDGNVVLKRAAKFDAQAQLLAEERSQSSSKLGVNWPLTREGHGSQRSIHDGSDPLNLYDTQTTKL